MHKLRGVSYWLLFGTSVIFMCASAKTAHADEKVYPAFMCLENGEETGGFNRSMHRITRTKGVGSGILLCPIVRDNVGDKSGVLTSTKNVLIQVNTFRTDPAPKIRLTFRKFSYRGDLIQEQTKSPLGGHQAVFLTLKQKPKDGYYVLEVEMGVNTPSDFAKFFSYRVIE
jgi:hypothetical protein